MRPDESGAVPAAPPFTWPNNRGDNRSNYDAAKLWTIGASVGSSFTAPWFVGTLRGTIAPFKYSFMEIGFDFGTVSGASDLDYYSLYPFIHVCFFMPVSEKMKGGLYTGFGGGFSYASYRFHDENDHTENSFAASFIAGVNVFNMIDISWTLKTDFSTIGYKTFVGYTYRFR